MKSHQELVKSFEDRLHNPNQNHAYIAVHNMADEIRTLERGDLPERPIDIVKVEKDYEGSFYHDDIVNMSFLLYRARDIAARKVRRMEKQVQDAVQSPA